MDVSVILCTYNRSKSLASALTSIAKSVLPAAVSWEVLIVDNNSTDETRQVAERFCQLDPGRFRYLFEGVQGKSFALNKAIHEARGHILAFVDDDVIVAPTWLHNLTACLQDSRWAGVGGRIHPEVGFQPPPWLALQGPWSQGGVLCAQYDLGDRPCEITGEPPYGANMAFRKAMFEKYGGFRTDLGRNGTSLIGAEDTEFGRRIIASGEHLRYEPAAVVYHSIISDRLTKKYFWSWWFAFGRAKVREEGPGAKVWGIPRPCFSIPSTLFRTLIPQTLRALSARDATERFCRQCITCSTAGKIVESWRQMSRKQSLPIQKANSQKVGVLP